MKKLFMSLLLLSFLSACTVTVQKDLINYINVEMPKLTDLEAKAIDAYGSGPEKITRTIRSCTIPFSKM